MHNKLSLSYKERLSEQDRPLPPRADFSRNGPGVQDLLHIDLKVKSEHRLCGKQYDAEMQLFYLHKWWGNFEAVSILIEVADGEHNGHFQKFLDYFQNKFDEDKDTCERKQHMARSLFDKKRNLRSNIKYVNNRGATDSREEEIISSESSIYQRIRRRILDAFRPARVPWNPLDFTLYRSVHFWSYFGSLTEPPCSENVRWRVMDVPMNISPGQYVKLQKLMFDHVDPITCQRTSTHFQESNARPVQSTSGSSVYRCRRLDYVSDMEVEASGRMEGFEDFANWTGVDMQPYIVPEFPEVPRYIEPSSQPSIQPLIQP